MKKTVLILSLVLAFLVVSTRAAEAAAYLMVSPGSKTYSVDDTFDVILGIDSGGEIVGGADGVGTYDSSVLELVSISQASNMVFTNTEGGGSCGLDNNIGEFSFSCYSNDAFSDTTAVGNLVTITFKGKSAGTGVLNYTCSSGSTTDSNIVKSSTLTDIISCSENQSGSYTISGSSTSETTTTPTSTSISTETETETELPQTGSLGVTLGLIAFGSISLLSALFLKFL